jgi:hypothetical protein
MGRSKKTSKDLAGVPFNPFKRYRPDAYYAPAATIYKQNTREQDHHETNDEHAKYWSFVAQELQAGLVH